jgi:hypothetical protein
VGVLTGGGGDGAGAGVGVTGGDSGVTGGDCGVTGGGVRVTGGGVVATGWGFGVLGCGFGLGGAPLDDDVGACGVTAASPEAVLSATLNERLVPVLATDTGREIGARAGRARGIAFLAGRAGTFAAEGPLASGGPVICRVVGAPEASCEGRGFSPGRARR